MCSLDFAADMTESRKNHASALRKGYILPDGINVLRGHLQPPTPKIEPKSPAVGAAGASGGSEKKDSKAERRLSEQVLYLNNERFTVPEVLFHPLDIGMNQAGVHDVLHQVR